MPAVAHRAHATPILRNILLAFMDYITLVYTTTDSCHRRGGLRTRLTVFCGGNVLPCIYCRALVSPSAFTCGGRRTSPAFGALFSTGRCIHARVRRLPRCVQRFALFLWFVRRARSRKKTNTAPSRIAFAHPHRACGHSTLHLACARILRRGARLAHGCHRRRATSARQGVVARLRAPLFSTRDARERFARRGGARALLHRA